MYLSKFHETDESFKSLRINTRIHPKLALVKKPGVFGAKVTIGDVISFRIGVVTIKRTPGERETCHRKVVVHDRLPSELRLGYMLVSDATAWGGRKEGSLVIQVVP